MRFAMASPKRNTVRRINFSVILAVLISCIAGFALSVKVLSRVSDDSALASPARDSDRQTQTKPKFEDARDASPLVTTGGKIAFGRGSFGRFDVWTLDDVGGTNVPTQITSTNDHDPVFSADGKKILFRSFRDGETGSGFNEIYSMNPDGYDQTRPTNDAGGEEDASYSPDATQIVFLRDGNLWKMNAGGTNPTMLADFEFGIQYPSFSPDGSRIVFEYNGGIRLMNADGTNQTPLNNSNSPGKPRFLPDGTKIIYDSNSSVYTININGTNETEIINGSSVNYALANPIYSPDGTKIVMECRVVTDVNVCTANADGTGFLAQAGTNVERSNPVWAPDSISIAYLDRNRITNKYRIFTNTINSTPTQVYLEDSNEILQYLAWQPVCIDMPTPTPTPLPGLISEWNANNSTAADSAGTNNGQFLNGAGLIDPGKVGLGFYFPGNGGYIEVPDSNSLDVQTGDYTLSTWFYPVGSAEHYVAGKGACGNNFSNFYIGVGADYVPFIDISYASGGSRVSNGAFVLSQSVWHHLLLKKQGTNFKLFVDGVEAVSSDETRAFNTGNQPFTIGKGDACTPPQLTTNGGVDEVRLYGRALTTAEITAIFSGSALTGVKSNAVCQPQTAPPVSLIILYPNPVAGGRATQGSVVLANAASSGGTTVNLISSDPSVMTVPASVTIPQGFIQANFPITSTPGSTFRSADVIATLAANTARATVSVAPSAPDVAASNLVAPASVNILQNFTATWTVTNNGQALTNSYRQDTFYISTDNVLFNSPNDQVAGRSYDDTGILVPGASKNMSFNAVNIPSSAIPVDGTYYLFVLIGDAGTVQERNGNFNDNFISIPILVNRNLPDLVAENIVAPAEVEPNVLFTINWNVRNAGSAATLGGFSHNLYFSFDGTVGNADDILVTQRAESAFGINQSNSYSQQFIFPTLPVRPSSDSFVYVKVDVANQVFEDNPGGPAETNNTTTRAARFEYRVPDLQVLTVTPPSEVESDTEFALAWTSTNAGNKNAGAFNERVFFSTDNIVNANDVQIGSFALPGGLAVGQSLNRIQNVTIPTNSISATGNYFVYVRTDADAAVDEGANENNNIRFQSVRVRRLLRPDLTVSSITAPATAFFDQEIQVQWTIGNAGQGPTNAPIWTDDLYLGLNQNLNGATRLAVLSNVSFLNAGESYIASATVRIPRGSNGSYFVIVRTDAGSNVNEENENNNITTRPITINIPLLPDLRVSNVQAPAEGFAGAPISLNWTVTNNGTGATPANENISTDGVYLSRDAGFSGDDILIGTRARSGNLAVNGTYSVSGFSVNLPTNVFGNYYVFVKADIYSQIYEFTSENNNDDYDRIQPGSPMNVLGTPPDLTVLSPITAPAAANAGQQIAASFTVRNQGAFDATGSWGEALYLSSDQTFNINDDTLLGAVARVNLPAGQQYPATINPTLPNCLSGTYYLFAVTDYSSRIFEFDAKGNAEANNISQPKAMIGFGNIPVRREVVNGTATPLTTTFTDSVISLVAPTAAGVNVSGRVTNSGGRGISKTVVTITDANGMVRSSLTNPFGYYAFENVASGQTYIISARHKKYQFAQPSIVVTLNDELTDADFVAIQ